MRTPLKVSNEEGAGHILSEWRTRKDKVIHEIDVSSVQSKSDLLVILSKGLALKDVEMNTNWDAFQEDFRELESDAVLIVLEHADSLALLPEEDIRILFSIIKERAEEWEAENRLLQVLLVCQHPDALASVATQS